MPSLRRLVWLLVLAVAVPAAARSQEAESGLFFDRLDVRVVNLEVFVTDGNGRAVRDLTRDDFAVFVDDREVELSHFAVQSVPAASPPPADDSAAPVRSAMPRIDAEPLLVVVYVDNSSLLKSRRDALLRSLRRLAAERSPGDMSFMVVTYDGRLERKTAFSPELATVDGALAGIAAEPSAGIGSLREHRRAVANIRAIMQGFSQGDCDPCQCGWDAMTGVWEEYAHQTAARVGYTAAGLLQLVRSISGLPGRKAVVYLSSGLQKRPGLSLATYLTELCPGAPNVLEFQANRQLRYDETELLTALSAEANTGRISLYPLQVKSSEFESGLRGFARLESESNLRDGLGFLAGETGGELSLEPDRLFETLESDATSGYELAFTPDNPPDGRLHRIRVELQPSRRGVELRYRRSYRDKLLEDRLIDRAYAVLSLSGEDAGATNPLGVEAAIRGKQPHELELRLPSSRLTRLSAGDQQGPPPPARVRIFLLIRNSEGRVLPALQKVIEVPAGSEPVHRVVMALELADEKSEVVVGVRDEIGDSTSFLKLSPGS